MALTPWEPFGDIVREPFEGMLSLRDAMNRLLEESVIGPTRFGAFGRIFPVDVRDTENAYVVEASLPGIKPDEMQVTATENTVTIRATRKHEEKGEKAGKFVRRERYEGEFVRTIGLPSPIDLGKISATYEQGVLTLQVPKTEAAKAREIKVQVKQTTGAH